MDKNVVITGVSTGIGYQLCVDLISKNSSSSLKKITSDTFTNSIILKRYGKAFFLELDIPENHIFNFISHCKKFNIKELYNKGFFLQIAVILERESTVYLKTLK